MAPILPSGALNPDFVETIAPILSEIHKFQTLPLPFNINSDLNPFFSSLPVIDDEELYLRSLKLLPSSVGSSSNFVIEGATVLQSSE